MKKIISSSFYDPFYALFGKKTIISGDGSRKFPLIVKGNLEKGFVDGLKQSFDILGFNLEKIDGGIKIMKKVDFRD